jgi:hypothetical protein
MGCLGEQINGHQNSGPWDGGNLMIKSTDMWDPGRLGMGRGWSNPTGCCREDLLWAQVEQATTKDLTISIMLGHQNFSGLVVPWSQSSI